jgi:hypothetical protein
MTTVVGLDLAATNAAGDSPMSVNLVAVVNPDGTMIGTGGGGVSPNINLSAFGGAPLSLGQMDAAHSMSVVIASDQTPFQSMTDLIKIGGVPIALGSEPMSGSVPVVIASDQNPVPVTFPGAVAVSSVGGTVAVSAASDLPVVVSGSVAVSGIASTVNIAGSVGITGTAAVTGSVAVTSVGGTVAVSAASALPVSIAGSLPVSIAATVDENLKQVGGSAITLGQKTMVASVPVALASDQTSIPVTGSVAVTSVAGTVTVGGSVAVASVAGTVSVSAASPLSENLAQVGGTAIKLGAKTSATSLPVVLATDQAALPVTDNLTQVGGVAITLGQKASAASLPVALSNEQVAGMSAFAFTAGSTQVIAATTTSANTVLGAAATGTLQLANAGTQTVFVAMGTVAQTANNTGYPVLPGAVVVVNGNSATNLAAVTLTGTATLYVSRGAGM